MTKRTGPTLRDVAAYTKLSPATISRILSNHPQGSFSPETVQKVRDAACYMGYQPIGKHTALPACKKKIVIICPSVMNPYYAILLQGIEQVARSEGYSTCIFTTYWDIQAESEALESLDSATTAGILYAMVPLLPQATSEYAIKIPTVVVGDRYSTLAVDMVELNNYNGGVLLANHLLDLGHQHIAYISTTLDDCHSARVMRLKGIQDTFFDRCPQGSVLVRDTVVRPSDELATTDIEHRVGYQLTKACLDEGQLVTAFAAINDMVAYGVINALLDAGKRIPQEYSVSGFDNIYPSRLRSVQLTTVEHSIEKKGRGAARLLIDKITGKQQQPGGLVRVEYDSFLVQGETTGPPRKE